MHLTENPIGLDKDLHDKIRAANGRYRIGKTTYRLSELDDGTQYLQRWRPTN